MKTLYAKISFLLFLSLICALFGLGWSYHSFITPLSSEGELHKISSDRWLQDGASITLKNLANRGNRLLISFNPWRPTEPAELTVSVCGDVVSTLKVVDDSVHTIYLKGSCEPRRAVFKVKNPFVPSAEDRRQLGAQINYIKISSRLGLPIIDPLLLAKVSLALFSLSLLVFLAFNHSLPLAILILPISTILLALAPSLKLDPPFSLWIFCVALALGITLYKDKLFETCSIKEAQGQNPIYLMLFVVCAVGFSLRFYGLDFGLPANFHPDEVPKFNAIQRMRSFGDLNPRYFLHPSLLLYSTYFANNIVNFFVNIFSGPSEWSSTLIFSGRIVSASAGIFSVFLTFLIGKSLFTPSVGLIGSALLAVSPLHITCSRYVKEDSLLTFFILLTTYLVVASTKNNKKWLLYLAGLSAGAAAATKYSGILAAAIIMAAPWLRSQSFKPDWSYLFPTLIACLLTPIGFVVCTPYALLDYQTFISDVASEQEHMLRGHMISIDAWSQYWMYHFYRSIIPGMTFISAFIAVAGIGILAYRRKISDLYLISLILLFYLPSEFVKAKPAPQPERYILPCIPFLALAGGICLSRLRSFGSAVQIFVIALTLTFAFYRSATLAYEIRNDTRDQMHVWMIDNIPKGSKILVDWKPYNPPFKEGEFDIVYMPREDIISHLRIFELKKSGADYLLLSSLYYSRYFDQPNSDPAFRDIFRKIFKTFSKVKEIESDYGSYGFHNPKLTLIDLRKESGT